MCSRCQNVEAAKWRWAVRRSTAHSCLALVTLFSSATVISTVAEEFNLQNHGKRYSPLTFYHWYSILLSNLFVASLFYLSGRMKSRVYFFLLGGNILAWAVVLSLIIPWMQSSKNWSICFWLLGYTSLEIFSYTLANAIGACRLRVYPIPILLTLAALSEAAGMQYFFK